MNPRVKFVQVFRKSQYITLIRYLAFHRLIYTDAISSNNANKWNDAMQEINSLVENYIYEITKIPLNRQMVGGRWVYAIKPGPNIIMKIYSRQDLWPRVFHKLSTSTNDYTDFFVHNQDYFDMNAYTNNCK